MKFISWNVNGLRACIGKGFLDYFEAQQADAFCIQETKMQPEQAQLELTGYAQFWNSAEKKGYSGTAVFSKVEPLAVWNDFGVDVHSHEGRSITVEYDAFYLVNVYSPNSQDKLARLPYRMQWEADFGEYLSSLDAKKPVVICGDMNVAHEEIDLKNPKTNHMNAGFSDEERACLTQLLHRGFVDSFRLLHPDARQVYSWWSYRFRAREHNAGWRIDYFLVSDRLKERIRSADIHMDVMGSDHCPVSLELDLS